MTKTEIIEFFHGLTDDGDLDGDVESNIFDLALDELHGERDWEFLKKKDKSLSRNSGDTYETAKTLPDDFISPVSVVVEDEPCDMIPFEKQEQFKNDGGLYFISAGKIYFTGSVTQTLPIILFYNYEPDPLRDNESPIFPERFHKLIAFYMAAIYYNIDFDDISLQGRLGDKNYAIYQSLRFNMKQWDSKLKTQAYNGLKRCENY